MVAATKSPVFDYYYFQDVISIASSHIGRDQKKISPEHRVMIPFCHRRTVDWKLNDFLLQPPIRQLEDQVGEITEPVK
jgi:hypothetical protein